PTPDGRVDRPRRAAVPALDQVPQLVHDGLVAGGREYVQERLRGEDLADRRREGRPADLLADPGELLEYLVEAIARCVCAQMQVERGDEPGRNPVLGCSHGDPGRDRGNGLVADVLVDELGGTPARVDGHAGV